MGRPRALAGTQAGLGSSGAPGGAAVAVPGRHGPHPQSSRGATAPSVWAPRERGARQDPDEAPRGARGTQTVAPSCVAGVGLLTAAPPPPPAGPQSSLSAWSPHRPPTNPVRPLGGAPLSLDLASRSSSPLFPYPLAPAWCLAADLGKQCAAVSTHWRAMSEPPHTCTPRCWMLACHGHSPARASWPPTIRLDA